MRGRIGGRIGSVLPPTGSSASGVWALADVYAALRGAFGYDYYGMPWPKNTVSISWPYQYYVGYVDWVDATETGGGTFLPDVTSTYPALAYSWEKSTDSGATWTTVSGETSASLALSGKTISDNGTQYRLVADAGLKVFRSTAGTLRYDTVTVSFYYSPYSTTSNTYVYFDASASAAGVTYGANYTPAYQWQLSTDGGSTWANISGATSSYLYLSVTESMDGYKYRAVASFAGQSATSGAATLTYGEGGY